MRRNHALVYALTAAGILLALGFVLSGCADNRAHEPVASTVPLEVPSEPGPPASPPTSGSVGSPALPDRQPDDAQRERVIAQRERELEERTRRLEAQIAAAEQRETSLTRREAELADRQYEQVLARRLETKPEPEPEPLARTFTLPASTPLEVAYLDALSSETAAVGDTVRARVTHDVTRDGWIVVPAGSHVFGEVAGVNSQKKIGGRAWLSVGFTRLVLPSGESLPIEAVMDAEGKGQTKKDAAIMGGSAAAGAVLGRVLAKDKTQGTLIGAVVGAAAGTAVAARNNGDPVVFEPDTVATVELGRPVTITVTEAPQSLSLARSR